MFADLVSHRLAEAYACSRTAINAAAGEIREQLAAPLPRADLLEAATTCSRMLFAVDPTPQGQTLASRLAVVGVAGVSDARCHALMLRALDRIVVADELLRAADSKRGAGAGAADPRLSRA